MHCKRSERAAGERVERLYEAKGVGHVPFFEKYNISLSMISYLRKQNFFYGSELRQRPIGARRKANQSRGQGKAPRNRFLRHADTP
jgi:hypothetical protein